MKILVVDDSKLIVKTILLMLKKAGYADLDSAGSVNEALYKIKKDKFDLIISDWKMPELTGIDLLKYLRKNSSTKNIPFIMATALSEKTKIMEALKLGVQGYLTKPINFDILVNKLNDLAIQYDLQKPTCNIPVLQKKEIQKEETEHKSEIKDDIDHHTETHISSYSEFKEYEVYEKQILYNNKTFQYFFGSGIAAQFQDVIQSYYGEKEFFLLTNNVFFKESEFYKELKKIIGEKEVIVKPEMLTIENAGDTIVHLEEMGLCKNSVLIALGGTEILGVAGLIGTTYMGGISTIWIPTTFSGILNVSLFPNYFINSLKTFHICHGPFIPTSVYVDFENILNLKKEKYEGGLIELIRPIFFFEKQFSDDIVTNLQLLKEGDWETLKKITITVLLKKIEGISLKQENEIRNFALPFIKAINSYYCEMKTVEPSSITKFALEIVLLISKNMNLVNNEVYKYYSDILSNVCTDLTIPPFSPEKLLKYLFNSSYYNEIIYLPKGIGQLHSFKNIEIRKQILEGLKKYSDQL